MLFYKKKYMVERFNGHWAWLNGCCLLSEVRRRHWNSILNRFPVKISFHTLLTFIYILIVWPLSPAASSVSWYCSRLAYEIYSGGGPSTYVYCVVCYQWQQFHMQEILVLSLHTFILFLTILNSKWTMRLLSSKTFFLNSLLLIYHQWLNPDLGGMLSG